MNGKKAKHLRRLVAANEPILMMTIRQHYGEKNRRVWIQADYSSGKKSV